MNPRRTNLSRLGALSVVTAGLVIISPALPATAESGGAWSNEACQAARQLIEDAHPQQARALVVAGLARFTDPCLTRAEEEAAAKVAEAAALAEKASGLAAANPDDAREQVDAALEIDADSEQALSVQRSLPPKSAPTLPESWKASWDALFKRVVDPLQSVLLPLLLVLVGLLVAARLLISLPISWPRTTTRGRTLLLAGGLTIVVLASIALTAGDASGRWVPDGILAALVGAGMVAAALATRLRMDVEVRSTAGTVDEAATSHVIALLGELGAGPPRGLEIPRGADVTVLDGTAISGTPEGKVLAALASAWKLVFAVTPWRVRVDSESDDRLSVLVTRNGRSRASAVVERDALGLRSPAQAAKGDGKSEHPDEGKKPGSDLHRMAAAVVLTALAEEHDGFAGLYGVTDWRSLGLHCVATSDYEGDESAVRQVLARAVRYDVRNLPAQVALRWHVDRDSDEREELRSYQAFLLETSSYLKEKSYGTALRMRVLMSLMAVTCNLNKITGYETREDVRTAGDEFIRLLADPPEDAVALAAGMRLSAATSYLSAGGTAEQATARRWLEPPAHTVTPAGHYNLACYLAADEPAQAIEHLRLAFVDDRFPSLAPKDPWLKDLAVGDRYREAFNDEPRKDLLTLPGLTDHADDLRAAGLDRLDRLKAESGFSLAKYLKVDPLVADRFIRLAALADSVPGPLEGFSVEITSALAGQGIDSPARLSEVPRDQRGALAVTVFDDIRGRCTSWPSQAALIDWLVA